MLLDVLTFSFIWCLEIKGSHRIETDSIIVIVDYEG